MRPLLNSRPSAAVAVPLLVAVAALVGFGAACGPPNPACSDCPDLAGNWTLSFDDSADLAGCDGGEPPASGPLTLTQVGSGLRATLGTVELQGTLFQSYDFSLSGSEDIPESTNGAIIHTMSGRFAPGQPALETSDRLVGTYTATYPDGCSAGGSYVATRVP